MLVIFVVILLGISIILILVSALAVADGKASHADDGVWVQAWVWVGDSRVTDYLEYEAEAEPPALPLGYESTEIVE